MEKEGTTDSYTNMDGLQKHYAESISATKQCIKYDSTIMKFENRQIILQWQKHISAWD